MTKLGVIGCGGMGSHHAKTVHDMDDVQLVGVADTIESKAVTLANKTLSLLAAGLPFIITGMPNFIRKPFILRLDECGGAGAALDACQAGFMAWQPGIREFLEEQDAGSRLKQLGIERGST